MFNNVLIVIVGKVGIFCIVSVSNIIRGISMNRFRLKVFFNSNCIFWIFVVDCFVDVLKLRIINRISVMIKLGIVVYSM